MYKICHHFVTNFVRLKPTATFVQEMYKSSTYFVIFSLQDMYDMFEQITFKGTLVLHNSLVHDLRVDIWDKIWSAVMFKIPIQACCDMPLYVESEYDRLLHYLSKRVLRHNNSVDTILLNPTDVKTFNWFHQAWWNYTSFDPNKEPQACANTTTNLRILRGMRNLRKLQHDVTRL